MKREVTYQSLCDKAESYCAMSEHCEQDVREKLFAWGCTNPEWRDGIIEHLVDASFIDHRRYCRAYVHDKLLYQGWGREKIRMMLSLKRLERSLIDEAIASIDDEKYLEVAERVARNRLVGLKTDESGRQKLMRYMLQRGFEYEVIKTVVSRLLDDGVE